MKNITGLFLLFLTVGFLSSCSSAPDGEKVDAKAATETAKAEATASTYSIDAAASKIRWTGSKPGGQHMGTISMSDGKFSVEGDNITAGEFVIDMNSITCTDLAAGDGKEDLEGHLKAGDFFEVEKFPVGKFVIAKVEKVDGSTANMTHNITGNLTMKGVTKSVTFPANIAILSDRVSAQSPSFTINRTEWGINFKSGITGLAKDKTINDEIGLVVTLVGKKSM